MSNESSRKSQSWLERVQEQSWEPEILISGIILFGLFQIPPYIEEAMFYLENYSLTIFSGGTVNELLGALLLSANIWLIIGFTTHLVGRSIWVAYVGLSYVYKDGIVVSKLSYQDIFKEVVAKRGDYKKQIIKLEKFCSRIFAISFLLFMCVLGVTFFLLLLGGFIAFGIEFIPGFNSVLPFIDPILIVCAFILFIDFVTLGLFKRIPIVSKIYYPLYRVMSFLTLAPLYRSIYYGIVSNQKSWQVGLAMFLFAVITVFMGFSIREDQNLLNVMLLNPDADSEVLYHGHYQNMNEGNPSHRIQIPSDIIESNVLKVFVVHSTHYEEEQVMKRCNYQEMINNEMIDRDSFKIDCLKNFYSLKLDGEEVSYEYLFHERPQSGQSGVLAYLDISELEIGLHRLNLYYNFEVDGEDKPTEMAIVEFYKTIPQRHEHLENQTREN
ncbi:MAG TPA: hypothetical protein VJ949_05930 [Cryomorphaceae bacterium]|nr:hypothetical protein [Cryomorphaceae bacterium]